MTTAGDTALAVLDKLKDLTGEVPVHYVSREDMAALSRALKLDFTADGIFHGPTRRIYINDDVIDPERRAHIILHEATHAGTAIGLRTKPELMRLVRGIMEHLKTYEGADLPKGSKYAFTNEDEFIAEVFANKNLREFLARTKIPTSMNISHGIQTWRRTTGFKGQLNSLWGILKSVFTKALGLKPEDASYLEASLAAFDKITQEQEKHLTIGGAHVIKSSLVRRTVQALEPRAQARDAKSIKEAMETNIADRLANAGDRGHKIADAIRTNDQIMRANEHLFHSEHLREMVDEVEKAGIDSKRHANEGIELTRQMAQLERKDGEAAQDFARLRYDATVNGVHLDRANAFSKDGLRDAQAKVRHPELQARFDKLSPEYKSMWTKLENFFQKTHNAISEKMVDYAIGATDVSKADGGRAGIRKRILDREMTDKDKELFSYQKGKALAEAHEISRVQGSYTPLNRYGDNAVRATYHVELPQGTKGTHVHEFELGNVQFANSANQSEARRQRRRTSAAKSPLEQIGAGSRWVDKNDPTKELDPGHADAIKAFTVRVQDRHFSLHDHLSDAQREAARLKADPMVKKVADVVKRSQNPNIDYEMSSPQLQTLINSLRQDKTLSADEKQITERALMDASYRMQAGNRVSHRRLPRMNVRGASLDLIHNVGEYARSTGAHLSRMDHAASIGNHLKELRQEIEARGYEGGKGSMRRSEVVNELERRIYGSLGDMGSKMSPAMQTAMTMSYMKAMGSPGHMLIRTAHPWMISTPVLGARHGYVRAGSALNGMYRDMGGLGAIKEGAKGFMRQALDPTKPPVNWMDFFAGRLGGKYKSEILDMWKQLSDIGLIHPEAGMEVHRMDATQNVLLKGLKRTDTAMREMTGATEALNRFAETGAAYRLARRRGSTHERAIRYHARDPHGREPGALFEDQSALGDAREISRRGAHDSRQFPQMIYNLLASNLYQAFKGETKEIKIEAAKKFAGVVATHALMAGALEYRWRSSAPR